MYEIKRYKELNGDFRTTYHNNNRDNDNKEHIPIAKGSPIKKNNNNETSSPTVNETYLKSAHNKETKKEDKYETMDTSYNKEEDKDKGMNVDSKTTTPDLPNPDKVIFNDDEKETT